MAAYVQSEIFCKNLQKNTVCLHTQDTNVLLLLHWNKKVLGSCQNVRSDVNAAIINGTPLHALQYLYTYINYFFSNTSHVLMQLHGLTGTRKFDHITPVSREFHWLPLHQHITFKSAMNVWTGCCWCQNTWPTTECAILSLIADNTWDLLTDEHWSFREQE